MAIKAIPYVDKSWLIGLLLGDTYPVRSASWFTSRQTRVYATDIELLHWVFRSTQKKTCGIWGMVIHRLQFTVYLGNPKMMGL